MPVPTLTSPICAQGATEDNPWILAFANPELKQSRERHIHRPCVHATRAHLAVIETRCVDPYKNFPRFERGD
jgi:hypothetical protein